MQPDTEWVFFFKEWASLKYCLLFIGGLFKLLAAYMRDDAWLGMCVCDNYT